MSLLIFISSKLQDKLYRYGKFYCTVHLAFFDVDFQGQI